MRDLTRLRERLLQLDGRGYPAYKGIRGEYEVEPGWLIAIEHVQGDPFADPSRVRAVLGPAVSELPDWARSTRGRRVACADYLGRALQRGLERASRQDGSGRSGELASLRPGQQVLARTNVEVAPNGAVTARLQAGLPAQGRRILGRSAADLLCGALPDALEDALAFAACDPTALRQHLETVEDAQALRDQLSDLGLVAFVGDGALLPRRSGVDDRPLGEGRSRSRRRTRCGSPWRRPTRAR